MFFKVTESQNPSLFQIIALIHETLQVVFLRLGFPSGIRHCGLIAQSMSVTEQLSKVNLLRFFQNRLCFRKPFFQCRKSGLYIADHPVGGLDPAV